MIVVDSVLKKALHSRQNAVQHKRQILNDLITGSISSEVLCVSGGFDDVTL